MPPLQVIIQNQGGSRFDENPAEDLPNDRGKTLQARPRPRVGTHLFGLVWPWLNPALIQIKPLWSGWILRLCGRRCRTEMIRIVCS